MPIAFVVTGENLKKEDYRQAMGALGREDVKAPNPEGFIVHLSGPTNSGWQVIDVWETEASAQALYGSDRFQSMLAGLPPVALTPWPLYRLEVDQTLRHMD